MIAFYELREKAFSITETHNLSFVPHIHRHVELVCATGGEIELSIGAQARRLRPGDLAIVFPDTVHSYRTESLSTVKLLIVEPAMVGELAQKLDNFRPESPFLSCTQLHPDALSALDMLSQLEAGNHPLIRGYLLVLMGHVLASLRLEPLTAVSDEQLLHKLLAYLREHYRQPLSLDSVGAALGVSRYQISRCFSQRVGCSFNSYINSLRVECAAELILSASHSVVDASFEAGFESLSTFYRVFQAAFGMSPKAYQRLLVRE